MLALQLRMGSHMTAKQISLTDEEIAAILTALRVRINDLHRLADNLDAPDDPGDLRRKAVELAILVDKLEQRA